MNLILALFALIFAFGFWLIVQSLFLHDSSSNGTAALRQIAKWEQKETSLWDVSVLQKLCRLAERFVYLEETAREQLARKLSRAGYSLTPESFTSRKYVILAGGVLGAIFCALLQFWVGIILAALLTLYGMLRQKEMLTSRLQEKDTAISMEMPRFVRTVCRNLRSNRDVYAVIQSYRKVAGPVLGAELDILLANMRAGSVNAALQQFQIRLGSEAAFRFCTALMETERGIDQTATLEYLADDMAREAKLNIQKTLSLRPGKMRMTYLPAAGVCAAMILYVLIVFVKNQLNTLF